MIYNPYKILAVDPSADVDVISAAYRALSKKFHPDVNSSPSALERMQEINQAYQDLKDPGKRKQIDAKLAKEQIAKDTIKQKPGTQNSTATDSKPNANVSNIESNPSDYNTKETNGSDQKKIKSKPPQSIRRAFFLNGEFWIFDDNNNLTVAKDIPYTKEELICFLWSVCFTTFSAFCTFSLTVPTLANSLNFKIVFLSILDLYISGISEGTVGPDNPLFILFVFLVGLFITNLVSKLPNVQAVERHRNKKIKRLAFLVGLIAGLTLASAIWTS